MAGAVSLPDIQLSIPDVKTLTAQDLDAYTPEQSEAWLIEKAPLLVLAEARTVEMRRAVGLHLWSMRVGLPDGAYGTALARIAREVGVGDKTLTRWRTAAERAEHLAPPSKRTEVQRARRGREPPLTAQRDKRPPALPSSPEAAAPRDEPTPAAPDEGYQPPNHHPVASVQPPRDDQRTCPTCKGAGVVPLTRPTGTNAKDRRDANRVDPKDCRHPTPVGDYCSRCDSTLKRGR